MSPEIPVGTVAGLAVPAIVLLAACAAAGPGPGGGSAQDFQTLLAEARSGLAEPRREVVRDQAGWSRLWADIHAGAEPDPPLPVIDFADQMLIVVASGTRPSGGNSIGVTRVERLGDRLDVEVLETCPAAGARVSMALVQPVEVIRLARSELPTRFRDRRDSSCR